MTPYLQCGSLATRSPRNLVGMQIYNPRHQLRKLGDKTSVCEN